jgi:hypothetical protein
MTMLFDPRPPLITVSRLATLAAFAAFAFISLITAGVLPLGLH